MVHGLKWSLPKQCLVSFDSDFTSDPQNGWIEMPLSKIYTNDYVVVVEIDI